MSYVLVQDVPASWERYDVLARALRRVPEGLLVHVAGPTDEGFRFIQVWDSEAAWQRFSPDLASALALVDPDIVLQAIVRHLRGEHLVVGAALAGGTQHNRIAVGPGAAGIREKAGRESRT